LCGFRVVDALIDILPNCFTFHVSKPLTFTYFVPGVASLINKICLNAALSHQLYALQIWQSLCLEAGSKSLSKNAEFKFNFVISFMCHLLIVTETGRILHAPVPNDWSGKSAVDTKKLSSVRFDV
jgi:hypothetical protein